MGFGARVLPACGLDAWWLLPSARSGWCLVRRVLWGALELMPAAGCRHGRCALEPVIATAGTSAAAGTSPTPVPAAAGSRCHPANPRCPGPTAPRQLSPWPSRPSRFPASNRAARGLGPPAPSLLPSRPNRTRLLLPWPACLPACLPQPIPAACPRTLAVSAQPKPRAVAFTLPPQPVPATGPRPRRPGLTAPCLLLPSPSRHKPASLAVAAQPHSTCCRLGQPAAASSRRQPITPAVPA